MREEHDWHWVGGVRGHWTTGDPVDHLFRVAMIGGDDGDTSCRVECFEDSSKIAIGCFDGVHGGIEHASVTNHVAVGEVHDDEIKRA